MKKLLSNFLHWKGDLKVVPMFLIVLLSSNLIIAQNKVRGTVKDATGVSIPGANVNVVGVSKGVSTGFDGQYEIDVPNNATLSFSFIGYVTKKVAVNGAKELNVLLTPTSEDLKEVVVNVGYGTQKRKDVNSSISSVKAKDLENIKMVSVDQMLQGKAAGVTVTNNSGAPGSAASVRVRGTTSISGTNEPLYVIDGVPVSGDATGKSTSGQALVMR
jgi:outer membrane receptor for ferrienterochelin and colicin